MTIWRDRLIARLRRAGRPEPEFPSYAAALSFCRAGGYDDEEIARVVLAKTIRFRDGLDRGEPLNLSTHDAFTVSCLSYCLMRHESAAPFVVVDFGGACGAHYFLCKHALRRPLRWIVVETEAMCATGSQIASEELQFRADQRSALEEVREVDLLHTSGAIQYTPDPAEVVEEIVRSGAKQIVFSRLDLGARDIITVQRSLLSENGIGGLPPGFRDREVMYPRTVLDVRRFESLVAEHETLLQLDAGSRLLRGTP